MDDKYAKVNEPKERMDTAAEEVDIFAEDYGDDAPVTRVETVVSTPAQADSEAVDIFAELTDQSACEPPTPVASTRVEDDAAEFLAGFTESVSCNPQTPDLTGEPLTEALEPDGAAVAAAFTERTPCDLETPDIAGEPLTQREEIPVQVSDAPSVFESLVENSACEPQKENGTGLNAAQQQNLKGANIPPSIFIDEQEVLENVPPAGRPPQAPRQQTPPVRPPQVAASQRPVTPPVNPTPPPVQPGRPQQVRPVQPGLVTKVDAQGRPVGGQQAYQTSGFHATGAPSPGYNQPGAPMNYQPPAGQASPPAKVMTMGDWLLTVFLSCIPMVNIIMLIIWSVTKGTDPNKQNYARAMLIIQAIGVVISIIFSALFFGILVAMVENGYYY